MRIHLAFLKNRTLMNLTLNTLNTSNPFCGTTEANPGTVSHTDGFFFAMINHDAEFRCLVLFFSSWTLQTREKFVMAMIGIFVLSIFSELFACFRSRLRKKAQVETMSQNFSQHLNVETQSSRNYREHCTHFTQRYYTLIDTTTYGIQILIGYFLMIATMTYSLEILACTCLGHAVGYAIFSYDLSANESDVNYVTTNPCCDFLELEGIEYTRRRKATSPLAAEHCCNSFAADNLLDVSKNESVNNEDDLICEYEILLDPKRP